MAIANKALVWGLFAAGGTLTAFVFPALIFLFLLISFGYVPDGLQYEPIHTFFASWPFKLVLFGVLFLSLWHAAHRLRSVAHDFGIRNDVLVARIAYSIASIGTLLAALYIAPV